MKKDIEWLKDKIRAERERLALSLSEGQETMREFILNNGKHGALVDVLELIDQLDEPEVRQIKELDSYNNELIRDNNQLRNALDNQKLLSQKWIDNNSINASHDGVTDEYVHIDDLKNLLVPKQEELKVKIQELIESYKQEEDAYGELENGWISGFIKDLKNLVEDEQKYYVLDSEDIPLLEKVNNHTYKTTTGLSIYEDGRDNSGFELTEREIKDYDERFWVFAVEVEE